MEAIIERCAGLDVHQATVVACVLIGQAGRTPHKEIRTFSTMTQDLEAMRDGRGQKPRQSFICNRYRCSGRVADWLGSLGYWSF